VAELGGKVYAVGGFGDSFQPVGTLEVYDPATDRWEARAPLPLALHHPTAVSLNGKLYVMGGFRGRLSWTPEAALFEYDPAGNVWHRRASMPTARGGLAAAALPDRILVFGGEAPFRIFNATEMYEPAGMRWIGKEPMPTPRHGIGVAVVGGIVYVPGGGTQPGFARTAVNEAYAP